MLAWAFLRVPANKTKDWRWEGSPPSTPRPHPFLGQPHRTAAGGSPACPVRGTGPSPAPGFRLGNVVHAVQATEQSMYATDPVPRLCLTLANLNRVLYFICDTILWVRSVGLTSSINKEKWRMWAARHYYYSLLLSLVRDLYEIFLQMEQVAHDRAEREKLPSQDPGCSVADEETEWLQSFLLLLFRSLRRHPPLFLDTVKNLCDILNPLHQLGIYKSNPGVIGLGGLLSSIAGIITVAYPHMKLKTH